MKPYYEHKGITIYHGDCREILPDIGDCDAIITDPPYGINLGHFEGDSSPMDFGFLFEGDVRTTVVWGANNFPQQIPFDPKRDGWLCWDKRLSEAADKMAGSPFELACVIGQRCYEILRLQHGGVINADSFKGNNDGRYHPTQKPVKLLQMVLGKLVQPLPQGIICDPFMGSGSTLIAAKKCWHKAIGIEIEEKYCEIAAKRLSQEVFEF